MRSADDHRLDDPADPVLDAMLEEVCGGTGPPDLRQQILDRWQRRDLPEDDGSAWTELPSIVPAARHQHLRGGAQRRRQVLTWWFVGATCLVLAVTTWWVAGPAQRPGSGPSLANERRPAEKRRERRQAAPRLDARPGWPPASSPLADGHQSDDPQSDAAADAPSVANADPSSTEPDPATPTPSEVPMQLTRLDNTHIVDQIDALLQLRWAQLRVEPAAPVDREVWCRRVFQLLVGREPNSSELRAFLQNTAADAQEQLVDHLLSSAHADELAEHWSQRWTAWLLENSPDRTRAFRTGLQNYLASALAERKPFDQLWTEMLTASGTNDPQRPDFVGGANYLLALRDGRDAAHVAAEVCRVMLGQRIACAQCHDDPLRGRSQQEFWQLAATFQQIKTEVLRPGRARLSDSGPVETTLTYVRPDGHPAAAVPGGLNGERLDLTSESSPRSQLAEQLIASPHFSREVVNRCWEVFFQYGFTQPVDDLSPNNLPSHPELVALLADQFVAHEYDFRDLLSWIALSDVLERSGAITIGNIKDAPTEGGIPHFSRAYHRPILFAQSAQGIAQLIAGQVPPLTYVETEAERGSILGQQLAPPVNAAESPSNLGARAQGQLLPPHYYSLIRQFSERRLSAEDQVEHAFLSVLGRRPTESERSQAEQLFDGNETDSTAASERLFWVLLNTARP
jgi:hypothetical protein